MPGSADLTDLAACPTVDHLVMAYLLLTGLIYLGGAVFDPGRLTGFAVHVLGVGVILSMQRALRGRKSHERRALRFVHAWYPPAVLPWIYMELSHLNRILWHRYFDPYIRSLEARVFPVSPVIQFSQWMPSLWVSESLHFAYTFYYFMIPILGFALYRRRRYREYQAYIWTLMMTFFFCYLWFIFFPVEGPRSSFPPLAETLQRGPFYRLSHWILGAAARGAAFPSSHVAAAMVTLFCAWRWDRKVFVFLLPLGLGLTLGTVYGRFHYAVDAAAGVLVAAAFSVIGPWTHERWRAFWCSARGSTGVEA